MWLRNAGVVGYLWCCPFLWMYPAAHAVDRFPYLAYVIDDEAVLRSGPGEEFFPTERLSAGWRLDVYRHEDEKWCAVRPTEASFSWVPSDAIEIISDDGHTGRVREEGTMTRVGSLLTDRMDVEYVPLDRGEVVHILEGRVQTEASLDSTSWYKIVPPAGEFRYIRRSFLRTTAQQPPTAVPPLAEATDRQNLIAASVDTNIEQNVRPAALEAPVEPATLAFEDITETPRQPAPREAFTEPSAPSAWRAVRRQSSAEPSAASRYRLPATVPEPPHLPRELLITSAGHDVLQLERLAADLQTMVQDTPERWYLEDLARQIEDIARASTDPEVQSDALDLLATTDHLEEIQLQYRQLRIDEQNQLANGLRREAELRSGTSPGDVTLPLGTAEPLAARRPGFLNIAGGLQRIWQRTSKSFAPYRPPAGAVPAATEPRDAQMLARYDGSGWLTSVISSRDGVPQYALTDGDANIVQFVQPDPGLNLRPYLKRRVGIVGKTHYNDAFDKPVLTADRVIVLDRTVR